MGFYLRKSVSVGPFRFNLSKSGIGVSAGITGLRLGQGPRGAYVHAGRGGIYYRKTLSTEPGGVLFRTKGPTEQQETPQQSALHEADSGPVLRMVDSSSAEVLQELNHRPRSYESLLAAISTLAIVSGTYFGRLPWWLSAIAVALALFVIVFLQQHGSAKRNVAMLYDLEPEVEKAYARLHDVFEELTRSEDVWHVEGREKLPSRGDTSDAAEVVHRKRISISTGLPPFVRSNIEVPTVPVGKQTLFFFPDVLLVFEDGNFGAVGYQELRIDIKRPQSHNDSKICANDKVVDIQFRSASGLNELLQVSSQGIGERLKSALMDLSKFSGEVKPKLT